MVPRWCNINHNYKKQWRHKSIFIMRKLILLLFTSVIFTHCSKNEQHPDTTYQIINNIELDENAALELLDGTLWEVTVFCLDDSGDIVREDFLDPVSPGGGKSEKKEVTSNIVKVVVSFKFVPRESQFYDMPTNVRKYTVAKYALTPETNNVIEFVENTSIKNNMSMAFEESLLNEEMKLFAE